jgi:hypothetical protein
MRPWISWPVESERRSLSQWSWAQIGLSQMKHLLGEEAKRRNVSVIGPLGVLRNAARADLLALPEALSKLQRTNFYVAVELLQSLLEEDSARRR